MRVTTDLWVSALLRQVFGAGGFAAVIKRGATEAGAIFILTRDRMGGVSLFGPAPQTSYETDKPQDRHFVQLRGEDAAQIEVRLEKEGRFDPDIWIVEIEAGPTPIEELIPVMKP